MTKKIILCALLVVNACDAQTNINHSSTKIEYEFSFSIINECAYEIHEYDLMVKIESEKVADDEKTIKGININVNNIQQALSVSPDTSILNGDNGYISFADINFDKIPDVALTTSFGTPNLYLDYWVFDVKQKKYTYVGNYPKFTLDENKKTLSAKNKNSAESYENNEWRWSNTKPEKIK